MHQHVTLRHCLYFFLVSFLLISSCKKEKEPTAPASQFNSSKNSFVFQETLENEFSDSQTSLLTGKNLSSSINLSVTTEFEISSDNIAFGQSLTFTGDQVSDGITKVFVRFAPNGNQIGEITGTLTITSEDFEQMLIPLTGNASKIPEILNFITFDQERLAFGESFSQSAEMNYSFPADVSYIKGIKMYVKLRCPTGGCDEWDVFAHVQVKDASSGDWYEMGRFITPYWNDNSQLERGFEFDVTDFKSLLQGSTELRIFTDCWNDKGYLVSVDFDFIEGAPAYAYSAISSVLQYNRNSLEGIPYGVDASNFDVNKTILVPTNTESTHLRTIITGWGHATPNDANGRPCAEWCYRTHQIKIDGINTFEHTLSPLNCALNPVSNQGTGNWKPDRAGWCPGMAVPIRIDEFVTNLSGPTFTLEYDLADWTSDGQGGNAFYAISNYVVVKSNTPIDKPVVSN